MFYESHLPCVALNEQWQSLCDGGFNGTVMGQYIEIVVGILQLAALPAVRKADREKEMFIIPVIDENKACSFFVSGK